MTTHTTQALANVLFKIGYNIAIAKKDQDITRGDALVSITTNAKTISLIEEFESWLNEPSGRCEFNGLKNTEVTNGGWTLSYSGNSGTLDDENDVQKKWEAYLS